MNIKQLFLISALCTFSAQAMQEVKENQEVQKNTKYKEIEQSCPNSIKFLIKILGQQKDVGQSSVIKKGLPEALIYKIIDEYLKENTLYNYIDLRSNSFVTTVNFEEVLKGLMFFGGDNSNSIYKMEIHKQDDEDYFDIEFYLDNSVGLTHYNRYFCVQNKLILDINSNISERFYKKTCKFIKINKSVIAACVFVASLVPAFHFAELIH